MTSETATRTRWILVVWISLMGAVSFVDRVNISIAGHAIAHDFRLSDSQLGTVFSAFFLGYGLFQVPAGWAVDRIGPRRTLALGAIWWAIFTALTASFPVGLVQAFMLFWLVRFLLGMGESVMYPSSNRWIANWIPTPERGLANGLIFAGVGAGSALTPPIIRYAMEHLGWRLSFWVCAGIGVAAGSVWYWLARDHPDQHTWPNDAERKHIREGTAVLNAAKAPKYSWGSILGNGNVWLLTFSYFCYGYTPAIFFTWFFIYLLRVYGLNLQSASYFGMLPFIGMSLGSAGGGWLADIVCKRWGRRWGRCGVAACGLIAAGAFIAAGSHVSTATAATVILALGAGSQYVAQSAYFALSADYGKGSAGSLSGFMNMAAQFGSALTAITTPAIAARFGWSVSFMTASAFCVVGGLLWLAIDPDATLEDDLAEEV